jgi:ketosteroid isomerase-like protein
MKRLIASVLLACAFGVSAWAVSSKTSSADSSAVDAVKQVGQDMGDAMIALDIEKLDRIFGDDWVTIGLSGKVFTKQMLLRDVESGKKKLVWFELGPMDVQIFGDVAIVQGNVAEKRTLDGKDTDMKLVYSDILNRRDGHWVVVRSMGANVK